jgi:hypothetical protein
MSGHISNLAVYVRQSSEAYRIRDSIRDFIDSHSGCKVLSCGRSCIDATMTEIEFRSKSPEIADRVVGAIRTRYGQSCEIDAETID